MHIHINFCMNAHIIYHDVFFTRSNNILMIHNKPKGNNFIFETCNLSLYLYTSDTSSLLSLLIKGTYAVLEKVFDSLNSSCALWQQFVMCLNMLR